MLHGRGVILGHAGPDPVGNTDMSDNEGRWSERDDCALDAEWEHDERADPRGMSKCMSPQARLEAIAELLALGIWRKRTGRLKLPEGVHQNREGFELELGTDRHLDRGEGPRCPRKGACP